MKEEDWTIFKEAHLRWPDIQINMWQEEFGELLQAWSHYKRGRCHILDVLSELAHVEFALNQLFVSLFLQGDGSVSKEVPSDFMISERERCFRRLKARLEHGRPYDDELKEDR